MKIFNVRFLRSHFRKIVIIIAVLLGLVSVSMNWSNYRHGYYAFPSYADQMVDQSYRGMLSIVLILCGLAALNKWKTQKNPIRVGAILFLVELVLLTVFIVYSKLLLCHRNIGIGAHLGIIAAFLQLGALLFVRPYDKWYTTKHLIVISILSILVFILGISMYMKARYAAPYYVVISVLLIYSPLVSVSGLIISYFEDRASVLEIQKCKLKEVIKKHYDILHQKSKELIYVDDYGYTNTEQWDVAITQFISVIRDKEFDGHLLLRKRTVSQEIRDALNINSM